MKAHTFNPAMRPAPRALSLAAARATLQRRPAFAGEPASTAAALPVLFSFGQVAVNSASQASIQAKLRVSQPGDPLEMEADRVADQVMRMGEPKVQSISLSDKPDDGLAQRQVSSLEEEDEDEDKLAQAKPLSASITPVAQREMDTDEVEDEEEEVQAKRAEAHSGSAVAQAAEPQVLPANGSGRPLDSAARSFMETRFGHDFGQVRVHTDSGASESARAVNARAYTLGRDVVFGAGQYTPGTAQGKRLLAHELVHTVQQGGRSLGVQRQGVPLPPQPALPQPQPAPPQPAVAQLTIVAQNPQVVPLQTAGNTASALAITGAAPNTNLRLTVQAMLNSGHVHAGNRPLGQVQPAQVQADQNGQAAANYTSNIVGGTERITITQQPPQVPPAPGPQIPPPAPVQASCDIDVHVTGLQELVAGNGYDLVGATATHPSNHFALAATNAALQTIAADFLAIPIQALPFIQQRINQLQQPAAPPGVPPAQVPPAGAPPAAPPAPAPQAPAQPLTDQQMATLLANPAAPNLQGLTLNHLQQLQAAMVNWPLLGYNDLSLEHGGVFDINGSWAAPHITHRIGNTLDFRNSNMNNLRQLLVQPIITRHGAQRLNEGNHWHLTF